MRCVLALLFLLSPALATAQPDFMAPRDEAVALVRDLIRMDTSNPPGNETKAACHLAAIFDREGLYRTVIEVAGRR